MNPGGGVDAAATRASRHEGLVRSPKALALSYLCAGCAWLWASGEMVSRLAVDAADLERLERVKGGAFMLFTAALLYAWLRCVRRIEDRLPQVERRLHDSENQISRLLESAPDAIVIHDATHILYANPAFFRLMEIPRDADLSKIGLRDVVAPDYLCTMRQRVRKLSSQEGIATPREISFRTSSGKQLEVEHASCSVRVGGRILVQSHLRDLTERNFAWRELQRWNEELDARVRERTADLWAANEALESFTYSVAHDLRSPVARVNGFATVLLEVTGRRDHAKVAHYAQRIAANAKAMGEMIDGMLLLSRTDRAALEVTAVDMAALVRGCVAEMDGKPAQGIEVQRLPPCLGDAALLREVWANLLSNAVKYSASAPGPRIVVAGEEAHGECIYRVEDNGIGFDASDAQELFRAFKRLGNARDIAGTGIGLSVVKRFVTRHGGRVWADGRPGTGATFHFALPRVQNQAP